MAFRQVDPCGSQAWILPDASACLLARIPQAGTRRSCRARAVFSWEPELLGKAPLRENQAAAPGRVTREFWGRELHPDTVIRITT